MWHPDRYLRHSALLLVATPLNGGNNTCLRMNKCLTEQARRHMPVHDPHVLVDEGRETSIPAPANQPLYVSIIMHCNMHDIMHSYVLYYECKNEWRDREAHSAVWVRKARRFVLLRHRREERVHVDHPVGHVLLHVHIGVARPRDELLDLIP